jgi:hypothetical protein
MNFLTEDEWKAKQLREKEERKKHYEKKWRGYEVIDITPTEVEPSSFQICACGGFMELIPSLPFMQPDKYWAGHVVDGQYVTSGSFLNRYRKQNNLERVDRSIFEEVQKKSKTRVTDAIKKNDKKLEQSIVNTLADVEIG